MVLDRIIATIKRLTIQYLDILLYIVASVTIHLTFRYLTYLDVFSIRPFAMDMVIFIAFVGIFVFFRPKVRVVLESIILSIVSILSFAQILHNDYFASFFSFRKLTVINELFQVKNEVFSKMKAEHILLLLIVVFYIILVFLWRKKIKNNNVISLNYRVILACTTLLTCSFSYYIFTDSIKDGPDWTTSDKYLYDTMFSKNKVVERFGLFTYTWIDVNSIISSATSKDNDMIMSIDKYLESESASVPNKYTGKYEGKNLILILGESFSYGAVSEKNTPNIYKMMNESITYKNCYAPIFQSATGDNEFISLTSMLPSIDYGTTSYEFHQNEYPFALPNLLRDEDYTVNSFHSYISNFYNREIFHEQLGFSAFYDIEKLGLERWEGFIDASNWIRDEDLFKKSLEITNGKDSPFFSFIITTSGHMPYYDTRVELEEYANEIMKQGYTKGQASFIAANKLLDDAIGFLFEYLKENGLHEDTVVVIYGDHYPYGLNDEDVDIMLPTEYPHEIYKVPLMIWSDDIEPNENYESVSLFDIYPTIANMFGLEIDDAFIVGRDLFSDEKSLIPFPDRSWIYDNLYFDSSSNEIVNSNVFNGELINNINNQIKEIFDIGQGILVNDYYDK